MAKKAKTVKAKIKTKTTKVRSVKTKAASYAAAKPKPLKAKAKAAEAKPVKKKPAKAIPTKANPIKSKVSIIKPKKAKKVRTKVTWPQKARELHNFHMNSTVWNDFKFRDDDIVIATYAKSGTTWTQQIIAQLIFGGVEGLNIHQMSPWVDMRILPPAALAALDCQTHRRFVKTHLPVDALVFSPKAKYIYIGRDGRDAAWSFHNHHFNTTDQLFEDYNRGAIHGAPPLVRGTADPHEFYTEWFAKNGFPIWPYWQHIRSWWDIRHLPNVMLVHFNDMKQDLEGSIRRIAAFLEIAIDEKLLPKIVEHCTFDYMKAHAAEVAPRGGSVWKGGATTFINKGSNGRWRDSLSADEVKAYEDKAMEELGPECATWLAHGGPV